MKINELSPKQKIIIISLGFIFISILLLLFLFKPDKKYGDEININNYDKYISNLPADRRSAINSNLYKIIKNNSKTGDPTAKDATIRDKSVKYNYDKSTDINYGSFIVDIKNIKQSYLISYEWSTDENNINLSGYTVMAECLESSKLIYGDFDCKDDFTNSNIKNDRNPILDYLPYSTFNYTITANINNDNKIDLNVDIILYSSDTRDGNRDISINKYMAEVVDWIKSKNLDPANYNINYYIN
jgi:hypothetical protein